MRNAGIIVAMASAYLGLAQSPEAAAEHAGDLQAVRDYALSYTKALPNYICKETIQRSGGRQSDRIEAQLRFVDRLESRTITSLNGKPLSAADERAVASTLSRGEFGALLQIIFDPATGADLHWDGRSKIDGRMVNRFGFRVPRETGYAIVNGTQVFQVPFKGVVYADADTSAVMRIEMRCLDIPAKSGYTSLQLVLEYRPAEVAGQNFILPYHYTLRYSTLRYSDGWNQGKYSNYRKFSADASITFGADDQ